METLYELDPRLNVLPAKFKESLNPWRTGCPEGDCQGCGGTAGCRERGHIHLLGIGGVAMCALAGLLKEAGYQVSGSDKGLYPPMSEVLAQMGITAYEGYERLFCSPDLVVVGNVVTRKFPVLREMAEKKVNYLSLPQTLNKLFLSRTKNLVVAGCHGKTSATALAAKVWDEAGLDPGFLIGGASLDFPKAFRTAKGEWFVIEGDEYDCAFFNKVPKFIHYRPHLVILTSIEFDHGDIYPDLAAVTAAFESLMAVMDPEGLLIANGDDPLVRQAAALSPAPVQFYGLGEDNDWRVSDFRPQGFSSAFCLKGPGCERGLTINRPGLYNALNAAAVSAAFLSQGGDPESLSRALADFKGVSRRQEFLGSFGGIMLVDDFAHHPTAVAATLSGLKAAFPDKKILAAFEPRSNTSRRAVFQDDYAQSLALADAVFLRQTPEAEKAPEGDRLDSQKLLADLEGRARLFENGHEIAAAVSREARSGDLIVLMSNGGFDGLRSELAGHLEKKYGKDKA